MIDDGKVRVRFVPQGGAAPDQELIRRFAKDLTESRLGPVSFEHAKAEGDSKVGTGLIEGVTVALAVGYLLRDLVRLALDWAQNAKNPVSVRIGDDELVLAHASDEQQEALVEAFLSKHSSQ